MTTPSVIGSTGRLQLGKLIAKGGEGAVYELLGTATSVAKIYHALPSDERRIKLEAMVSMATPRLLSITAWPSEVLKRPDGSVCGFLMPNIKGHKDIHTLYGPRSRRQEFPDADWRFLIRAALNIAKAFATLHEMGCVIGDVNHGGIRVSKDATVKLIDCDSFQILVNHRYFLCEVGVENFTPPELQGKPFKGVVRTPNHDNFGLAVMIFNLLMMGRHPFAGRYSGKEEMPVEKAISQFRYVYGGNKAQTQMSPPPLTPPVLVASREIADLWERSFSKGSVTRARPSAKDWITILTGLERNIATCGKSTNHHFAKDLANCPWCPIEASGLVLFGVPDVEVKVNGGTFYIDQVWQQILSISPPIRRSPPTITHKLSPTKSIVHLIESRRNRLIKGRACIAIVFTIACVISSNLWLLWAIAAFVAWSTVQKWAAPAVDIAKYKDRLSLAETAHRSAQYRWDRAMSSTSFQEVLRPLERLNQEWRGLGTVRQLELKKMMDERERIAKYRYLDQYEIAKTKIQGIGQGKLTMLENFGIETAANVIYNKVLDVPGFGPALASRLVTWRRSIEQRFKFDPKSSLDPRDIADLDRKIKVKRIAIENDLRTGAARLTQIKNNLAAEQNAAHVALEGTMGELEQARVDLNAILTRLKL